MRSLRPLMGLSLALLLVLGTSVIPTSAAQSGATAPIKIGVAYSLTGVWAGLGNATVNAIKQALDEEGNQAAGRRIELVIEDDQGKPDAALTAMRRLVELRKVDLLHAILASALGEPIRDYVHPRKVPWLTVSSAAGLTRDRWSPYVFRFIPSTYQWAYAPAKWLKEKQAWSRIYWIGSAHVGPREAFEAIKKVFADGIVDAMWPPPNTPDYAPYLAKVDPSKADGIIVAVFGADSIRVVRQYAEYGLRGKLPALGMAAFSSEEVLAGMPPEAEGFMSAYTYCGTLNTPENKRFVEGFKARYKGVPGSYPYMAYAGAKVLLKAIEAVGGQVENTERLLQALRRVQLRGPMGTVGFDEKHGMVADLYVLKVVKKDGQLQNECVDRIPQVKDPYDLFP